MPSTRTVLLFALVGVAATAAAVAAAVHVVRSRKTAHRAIRVERRAAGAQVARSTWEDDGGAPPAGRVVPAQE